MATHLIRKQIVEVELPFLEPAPDLQQRVSRLVQEQLNPALNEQFDLLSGPNQILRLDQVSVTVQISNTSALEDQLVEQVLQSLEKVLSDSELKEGKGLTLTLGERNFSTSGKPQIDEEPTPLTKISEEESLWEAFVFFLRKGYLPWWAFPGRFEEFTAKTHDLLQTEPGPLLRRSLTQLLQTKEVVERLAFQFPKDFLRAVLQFCEEKSGFSHQLQQVVSSLPPQVQETWKKAGLVLLPEPKAAKPKLPTPQEDSSTGPSETEEKEGLYLQNAGLVLLAPFLETYLHTGGLVEDHLVIKPLEAVHWLQFLVTGQTRTPEPELLLNKLLCGIPLDTPVPAEVDLPPICEKEAQNVLEAVIRYWVVLKNTSPAGLREGFLQRSGRLSRKPDGDWLLQVEQKSYDMLLGSLPWSYSLIKLPWMPQALWVDWA
ncbi:contractile injection system tape measure protein [Rufibacter psychrotolerans]|uniref:contractile injection system tape measure protein n=1 Tax=Rufibacter psychrotolerans TaxID=2812556 RepID=UPI001F074BEA|nr:contractile injection system tape measure protein [Rufibacter sp. SYSU D00308]